MNYRFFVEKVRIKNKVLYDDAEIIIPKNGITIVSGRNGCGKTTLLNQILFQNPEKITLIAQENDLIFSELSVKDNIMLLFKDEKKLLELLKLFGVEYILERSPMHLSGGEKRIVSLLRMGFSDSDIILIDEPTNDLDYNSVEIIKEIILTISKSKSLLIVTHDDRLLPLGNVFYSFENGKIISKNILKDEEISLKKNELEQNKFKRDINLPIKKDVFGNFIFALSIVVVLASALIMFFLNNKDIEYIKDGQTNIASKFYANYSSMIDKGYIPIEAYKAYEGKVDLDYLETYSKCLLDSQRSGGSLNMFLDKELGEHVYICAFMDMKTNSQTYLLKEYQTLREYQMGYVPNFSDYLTTFDGIVEIAETTDSDIKEKIDDELYFKLEKACEETFEFQPTFYIVLGLNKSQLKSIEGNFFIKNNESVDICNDINMLMSVIDSAKFLAFGLASELLFYFLYLFVSIKQYKKHITVFRNLGVSQSLVKKMIFNRKCTPVVKLIISAVGGIICVCFSMFTNKYYIISTILAVISFAIGIFHILLSKKVLDKSVYKVYSFGGIYGN